MTEDLAVYAVCFALLILTIDFILSIIMFAIVLYGAMTNETTSLNLITHGLLGKRA